MPTLDPALVSGAVRAHPDGATVALRVIPRAPTTRVTGMHGEAVKIKVAAPPVDGAANAAVCAYLAERCGKRPGDLEVVQGERSRQKIVLVRDATVAEVIGALAG